jgi:hypothetical protein
VPPLVSHEEFLWARMPFLAPMADAIARQRSVARLVTHKLDALVRLLLDHLGAEQRLLARPGAAAVAAWIGQGMVRDHVAISAALDEILVAVASWQGPTTVLERRFRDELAILAQELDAQITLEELLMTQRLESAGL